MYTILVLTEQALTEHDAARIAQLHSEGVEVHLLVPADSGHNRLEEALDEIALGRIGDALEDTEQTPEQAEHDAMHAMNASIDRLMAAGLTARGSVTARDPLPAAREAARQYDVNEIVVVTPPHLVREALHRDWASRLRDEVRLPVLHFVTGTDRVVS